GVPPSPAATKGRERRDVACGSGGKPGQPLHGVRAMRNVWLPSLLIALFACGPVAASTPGRKSGPRFEIDAQGRVVRVDTCGKVAWAARLDGKLGGREPQLLWDAKRVYVHHNDGVTALAARTGIVLWHVTGGDVRLALCGHLLLSTRDGCVTARAVPTGAE